MNAVRPIPLRPDAPDEELMRQLAAGQQEALGPLYARYAPLIYGLGVRSLDAPAAEEVVQDVLLSVWRAAGTYDPERGAVRSWVLQIAHYRILNELRRRSRRPKVEPDPEGLRLLELPDREPDPAELAERAESRAAVRAALAAALCLCAAARGSLPPQWPGRRPTHLRGRVFLLHLDDAGPAARLPRTPPPAYPRLSLDSFKQPVTLCRFPDRLPETIRLGSHCIKRIHGNHSGVPYVRD